MIGEPVRIVVLENDRRVLSDEYKCPVEFGRIGKDETEASLFHRRRLADRWRVAVARLKDVSVSRRHLHVEPLSANRVRIANLSHSQPLHVEAGGRRSAMSPNTKSEHSLPISLVLGSVVIRVEQASSADSYRALAHATLSPGSHLSSVGRDALPDANVGSLVHWLRAVVDLLHSAVGSADFCEKAARALVDLVGLDIGCTLLWQNGHWETAALITHPEVVPSLDWQPEKEMLDEIRVRKRTLWTCEPNSSNDGSPVHYVASPILNCDEEVIGVLYAERRSTQGPQSADERSELQASLVELLACGVASGLARTEQEQIALETRGRFGQFFSDSLVDQLFANPGLLEGRDAEVTILFADIRGFSRISRRIGPAQTMRWIQDTLGSLSQCVLDHQGVLVDYLGDELMAMWGAPHEQPDHAERACRAALDMTRLIPELNSRWESTLGEQFDIGVGLNTGIAHVGNSGSLHRFKYGPLGNTVNLASRLQGVTKYLKCRVIISGTTRKSLDGSFAVRRLCAVRVVNISDPVDIFELVPCPSPEWAELKEVYETALVEFERERFRSAIGRLGKILERIDEQEDGPALLLLSRIIHILAKPPTTFDPVWVPDGK